MKRLITERDLAALPPKSSLAIERDTIVTPAARDAAFLRGITFLIEGATAGATAAKPASDCGCGHGCGCSSAARLPDGDYLVRVRGGKSHVERLGT